MYSSVTFREQKSRQEAEFNASRTKIKDFIKANKLYVLIGPNYPMYLDGTKYYTNESGELYRITFTKIFKMPSTDQCGGLIK